MTRVDACPGVLRPHLAGDGWLVRLRVPGGQTTGRALAAVSRAAVAYGNGAVQLTSRAGLQVRGLPDPLPAGFLAAVASAGLLPSATHERVRNVVASPLTGLVGGRADVRPLVAELDARLQAAPELTGLSGRFLFALDDGRGDVAGLGFDLGYVARDPGSGWVLVGDRSRGRAVPAAEAARALVDLAVDFLAAQPDGTPVWHVRDLPGWAERHGGPVRVTTTGPAEPPLGAVGAAASVAVPLALLSPTQAAAVAAVVPGPAVLTPWRGIVLPGAADRLPELAAAGLVPEPDTGWTRLTACVGAPGCARSRIDTRRLAAALAARGPAPARVHVSGCERRCGAPATRHVDLVAPDGVDAALATISADVAGAVA